MASNAIGLAMQLTANTSGLSSGIDETEKLINKLGRGAVEAGRAFEQFRDATTGELPSALQSIVDSAGSTTSAFREGITGSEEFATEIERLAAGARELTKAFQEGSALTAKYTSDEERRTKQLARLAELLEKGAISQQTYDRAVADTSGSNAAAAAAEKARLSEVEKARRITESALTPQQKYDNEVEELQRHLNAGRISQETYNSALNKATKEFTRAAREADKLDDTIGDTGLRLNELSGAFSILPGPIGSVAGRISGITSAGEGLGRIFTGGGGVIGGLESLGATVAGLVNPFTLAVAGLAAFGAAATAVARGLISLEDRVEKLGVEADKVGLSFEFIQTLETAANRTGLSVQTLSESFNQYLRNLTEAQRGTERQAEAFAKAGISAEDLASKSPEEVYRQLAVAVTEIADPAERASVVMAALGESGLRLLPTFQQIAKSEQDMQRFFAVLTEVDKVRLDNFGASVDTLNTATQGLSQSLLLPFTGLGDGIAQGTAEFVGGITAIVKPIGQILEPALTNLGRFIEIVLSGLGAMGRTIGAVLAPLGDLFQTVGQVLDPLYDGFVAVTQTIQGSGEAIANFANQFSIVGAAASYVRELADDIRERLEPVGEVFGKIAEFAQRAAVIIGAAFEKAREVFAATVGRLIEDISAAISAFLEFTGLDVVIQAVFEGISQAFSFLYNGISEVISRVGGFIETVLEFAENWLGIKRNIEEPITAELDISEPLRSATQFYDEITKAVDKTKELGTEGFDAALKYQQQLEELALLAEEGELTEEQLQRAVAQTTAEFERSIAPLEAARKAREDAAKAAERAAEQQIAADRKVAESLIEQQRIDQEFGGDTRRAKAAENLLAIQREIARTEEQLQAARAAGDQDAIAAANQRLASLDQAEATLQDEASFGFNQRDVDNAISKVRSQIEDSISQADVELAPDAADDFFNRIKELERQLDLKIIDPKQFEEATKAAQRTFDEARKQAEKLRDLEIKYAEEVARIQQERVEELAKTSQQALTVDDIRTSGGASEFIRLASGREDPAIEEYRKQTKKLEDIRKEIAKANQQPVEMI